MQLYRNLLSYEAIDKAFNLFRTLPNNVVIDGERVDRHAPSAIGHFLLAKFTNEEFDFVWQEVKEQIKDHSLVYARILKYNRGCFIQPHVDSYTQGQSKSNKSLIIQMNPTTDFKGGAPFVNNELIELESGDGVLYQYSENHEVKPVRKGLRYVINLRLKTDK
ncbi:MAG: hypothetical protein CMO97_06370 [Woeseia sp.]|nr:hypothetical protein [Woeseia sp.]